MYNVIIWGTGDCYRRCYNSLKLQELTGQIKVLAVTSNDKDIKTTIDGYPFLSKEDAFALDYDYCLVAIDKMTAIFEEVEEREGGGKIRKELLIPMRVLLVPNFNFAKYITLRESKLSICSINCWGGHCYHQLGLEFLSPTINLYFSHPDFNKFMKDFDYYISLPVEPAGMQYEPTQKRDFPVGLIGDIRLYFNHYADFDYANECWGKRKKRINKNNMLVVSWTEAEDIAIEFDSLPYEHKIIFTSFETDLKSGFYIHPDDNGRIWRSANAIAIGRKNLLDLIALCNHEDNYIRTH